MGEDVYNLKEKGPFTTWSLIRRNAVVNIILGK